MALPAIRVESASKLYRLGQVGTGTLSHDLNRWWARIRGEEDPYLKIGQLNKREVSGGKYVWALKDVSFDVQEGEILGIIGRNGAGKSTLLKLLSRITAPSMGRIRARGRIASLLEVGTGFHPELTGRENIFLNGAILGMKRTEIRSKFDDIVEFSGCAKYVDTPVKRYSTGMHVRLAFAVAAHLDAEILLVDEVLAVGDVAFQKKCLGKIEAISKNDGRTVLFVSHNMPAVQKLTTRSLLIENGRVTLDDSTPNVIEEYLSANQVIHKEAAVDLRGHAGRVAGMEPALVRTWITDGKQRLTNSVSMGDELCIHVEYEVDDPVPQPVVGIAVDTRQGLRVFAINNKVAAGARITDAPRRGRLSCHINRLFLTAGDYHVTLWFATSAHADVDHIERAMQFTVVPNDVYGTGIIPGRDCGACFPDATWAFTDTCSSFRFDMDQCGAGVSENEAIRS